MASYGDVSELNGKTITEIVGMHAGSESVDIYCSDGSAYRMYHEQDCCESVELEDVVGDYEDLLNTPMIEAREDTNHPDPGPLRNGDCYQWTFYRFYTIKGTVVLRWYGASDYYSTDVSFRKLN